MESIDATVSSVLMYLLRLQTLWIQLPKVESGGGGVLRGPEIANAPSGGTKRATSESTPLLRLQSTEGKFTTSHEIEPVRRSFRRHGSSTFAEVARLVPSGSC